MEEPTRASVSIGVVAKELGLSTTYVRTLADRAALPALPATEGGHRRFDLAAVRDAWARRQLSHDPAESTSHWRGTYPLQGLAEDAVWADMSTGISETVSAPTATVLGYVVTEMVNNAIDHSGGRAVDVSVHTTSDGRISVGIDDDGEGVFRHLAIGLNLDGDIAALGELSKGKRTTDPERHTGEGIFFSSKVVDEFRIEANGFRLTFDNVRDDFAYGASSRVRGTSIRAATDANGERELSEVFRRFTEDFEFTRTRLRIKLFELGQTFISRSEAKRIADGLERFIDVELDFAQVIDVGQGFADELFRVWAHAHPDTRLQATSMNEAVAFMIDRARAARQDR